MLRLAIGLWLVVLLAPTSAHAKYPWEKEPGPIAGSWRVTCPERQGMVIRFSLDGTTKATGKIAELGSASKYGYRQGEEILRLTADDFGKWVGQLKWRNLQGTERWDPITFVATAGELDASMTTDGCYKKMPRAR